MKLNELLENNEDRLPHLALVCQRGGDSKGWGLADSLECSCGARAWSVRSEELKEKWGNKRCLNCANAGSGRRTRHEKVDITTYSKEEGFCEFWNEGTVKPVDEFLADKGLDIAGSPE
eukprot:s135_g17.t1